MNDRVWISFMPGRTQTWKKVTNDWYEEGDHQRMNALRRQNDAGEVLKQEDFPPRLFGQLSAGKRDYERLGDVFTGNCVTVVSRAFADVMAEFNLVRANLFPVPILEKDKVTPVPGEWFFLNYGNPVRAFIPDQTDRVEQIEGTDLWQMPANPKDGEIVLSAEAMQAPDIWVDPRCLSVFFLSDGLVRALKEAGMTRHLHLRRCRIVC